MSNNDTKTDDSVEEFYKNMEEEIRTAKLYYAGEMTVHSVMLVLTTATMIYGVISWYLMKQFRNYKNFVFFSTMIANVFGIIVVLNSISLPYSVSKIQYDVLSSSFGQFLVIYAVTVRHHWLIVICNMFYVDIAKVYNGHVRKKYLKSSLFVWVAGFITTIITVISTYVNLVIYKSVTWFINVLMFMVSLPVILNCILYFAILCSLCRSSDASGQAAADKRRRLYIATLIFLLSDLLLLSVYVLKYINYVATVSSFVLFFAQMFLQHFNPLMLNIYFVVVKSNRELWYAFYVNKLNERQVNRDIQMNVRNRPAVAVITIPD